MPVPEEPGGVSGTVVVVVMVVATVREGVREQATTTIFSSSESSSTGRFLFFVIVVLVMTVTAWFSSGLSARGALELERVVRLFAVLVEGTAETTFTAFGSNADEDVDFLCKGIEDLDSSLLPPVMTAVEALDFTT